MIGIYFKDRYAEYPFDNEYYVDSYSELISVIEEKGLEYRIVRGKETYLGDGNFSESWLMKDRKLVEAGAARVSVIYNKGRFEFDDIRVVTDPWIDQVTMDKNKLAQMVGEASPSTYLVKDHNSLEELLDKYFEKDEVLVLKPNKGSSGRGVVIGTCDEVLAQAKIDEEHVLQKLIDSSCGYKDLVSGVHDFRVIMVNGELMYGVIRIPKKGSLLTNFAQGATRHVLEKHEVPSEFKLFAKGLDDKLFAQSRVHRALAYDCMNTPEGIRLVEINGSVGLDKTFGSPSVRNFHEALVDILIAD